MKKYLLIAMFGFVMCNCASGQTYHPFPVTNGNWVYRYYDYLHNPTGATSNVTLSGDTIIGIHTYKKLSATNYFNMVNGFCIREENKIIYCYIPDSAAEFLLYDFNLQVGDTLFDPYYCCGFWELDTVVIAMIDSVLLDDGYYHTKWYDATCGANWIDGVGSIQFLFSAYNICSVSGMYLLECFTNDSGLVYHYGFNPCIVGVSGIDENASATIYPNPVTDKLNITLTNNESSQIILYDITSRKLLQQTFSNSVSINTTQLESGIYFYEVRNKNGVMQKGKVVKE